MTVKNVKKTQKKVKGRPFQKGNPGGPGRPKKEFCIPDIIRKVGREQISDEDKRTFYDAMVRKAWEQAIDGDRDARKWISDRTEGRPVETVRTQEIERDEVVVINLED